MNTQPVIFALVLHSHIPYCRKSGIWPAGEEWLYEAMYETYLPLLKCAWNLQKKGISPNFTINITPVLAEQLNDGYIKSRFHDYLQDKIERAKSDIDRFTNDPARQNVARFHLAQFEWIRKQFTNINGDILGEFRKLQESNSIEIITCSATHAFLPLLSFDTNVNAQVKIGVDTYNRYFGKRPQGIWIPECAYRGAEDTDLGHHKAIDEILIQNGLHFFFVDTHGIVTAEPHNGFTPNVFYPYRLSTGAVVFGRNPLAAQRVWSQETGYPGERLYREFHLKDSDSGLHYSAITDKRLPPEQKAVYEPEKAYAKAGEHARDFVESLKGAIGSIPQQEGIPVIVAPFDTELFGHWWAEGVQWIEDVFTILREDSAIEALTISDYLSRTGGLKEITMHKSSWGEKGDYTVWTQQEHNWIWPYIKDCEKQFMEVINANPPKSKRDARVLNQAGRELLLMEGSDWPFLMYTMQAKDYANQRFHTHHQRFLKLIWQAKDFGDFNRISDSELAEIEEIDNAFSWVDWTYWK